MKAGTRGHRPCDALRVSTILSEKEQGFQRALLGGNPPFNDAEFACYGTEPFEPRRALPIDELKRRFDLLGLDLDQALKKVTPEQLTQAAPFSPTGNANETVGSLLVSIAFHEAYHLGQTGLSRRLLGKAGALLAPGKKGHQ